MNKKVFQIRPKNEPPTPFVVEKNQNYRIRTLGYVDLNNPSAEAIVNPLDEDKVTIKKISELLDGASVYTAEHNCDCGANIEVSDTDTDLLHIKK